jgi:sugar O-acyltransferase (sialic acid O-acetyltransferase NeuD family)
MNLNTVLVGCGGHGKTALDTALKAGISVCGICDPNFTPGQTIMGVPVIGGDSIIKDKLFDGWINGIGLNPTPKHRISKFLEIQKTLRALTLIHPSVQLGNCIFIGDGAQIFAGAIVQCNTKVGVNVVINTGAIVEHDCSILDHAFIAPGAIICGGTSIGGGSLIGAGAIILPGLEIGQNVVVGAGAVVTKSINNNEVVVGNPAKLIQ